MTATTARVPATPVIAGAAATAMALLTVAVVLLTENRRPTIAGARAESPTATVEVGLAEPPPAVTSDDFRLPFQARVAEALRRDEVREVQKRLWGFGFNAGPVDGAAGPRTLAAAQQYRRQRGLMPATDTVDYDLLDRLRHDRSPQVARRPPRSNNPFDQIAQWFQSLGR